MAKNTKYKNKVLLNVDKSTVILISDEILNFEGDAIVNSTSTSLDLSGSISKTLLQAGGKSIKTECRTKYPNGIHNNQVAITSAGTNSKITNIYHIALPQHKDDSKKDLLAIENAVTMSLEQFQTDNYATIGIPTIGCGGLAYPEVTVATGIFNAIQNFLNKYKNYQSKIVIIVSSDNENRFKIFEKEFQNFKNYKSMVETIVPCKLALIKADIFATQADVFVNTTSKLLDLTGKISKVLIEKGGKAIESECRNKYPDGISNNQVAVTSTGKIQNYKTIYHIALPPCNKNSNHNIKAVENVVDICLTQLVNDGYSTIVFPTIGCGGLNYSSEVVATGMLNSIKRFYIKTSDPKYKITVVVAPNENETYDDFEEIFNKAYISSCYDSDNSDDFTDWFKDKLSKALDNTNIFKNSSELFDSNTSLNTASLLNNKLPAHWDVMNNNDEYKLLQLQVDDQEYTDVCNDFKRKFEKKLKPKNIKVERIQNQSLFLRYELFKEQLSKSGPVNEMTLYHGTKHTQHKIENICRGGFKRNYSGKAGVYGNGVYFALNSEFSHTYTDQKGRCYMFVAKVAVGSHTLGDQSMTHPPINPLTNKEFNSTTNDAETIFAIFDDSQSYPEYLITYEI